MKLPRLSRYALIGVASFLLFAGVARAARFADPAEDVARAYEVVDARLALMSDIAAWKWSHQQPIVDEERERVVIDESVTHAHELGFDPVPIRRLAEVQVQLARAVQTQYFEIWRSQGFPSTQSLRDLQTELRPALDTIGEELLAALFWAQGNFQTAGTTDAISKVLRRIALYPGVTAQDLSKLRAALHEVRGDTKGVDSVTRLHTVRIGTTGDYAPFSLERNGELRGLDISLAESMAAQLGLKPRFVRTTWPTLMSDLESGRFDVALSGISNTPERAARAEFSTAYHVDGKAPIARCEDRARFGSLSDIDRAEVRIIVNPGGSNQQFVREHIEHAKVIVHADNRSIFDEIVTNHADVMITDALEIELQTRLHKELCRTMNGTMTNAAKAALLPQGSTLTKKVDQWLQAEVARGGVQEKLQRAMMED